MFKFFTAQTEFRLEEISDNRGTRWEIWEKRLYSKWKYHFVGDPRIEYNKDKMLHMLDFVRAEERRKLIPTIRKVIA